VTAKEEDVETLKK